MPRSFRSPRMLVALIGLAAGAAVSFAGLGAGTAHAMKPENATGATFQAPSMNRSFADVVEQVSPAVVNIKVTKMAEAVPAGMFRGDQDGEQPFPFDDFFEHFFGMPGIPQGSRQLQGQGSGFVIDKAGYVVTNNHVVDGANTIVVVMQDGRELDAKLVGTDPKTDLALLKIDSGKDLPWLRFGNSDAARVGDWVLAIGNPFGLGGTATAGIISARGRDIRSGPYDDFLQIDAPINSGNSGGPVFNADGEVIGVNTAIYSPNGGSVGIGFAIPASQVTAVVNELRTDGTVQRGWLGVQIQDVDADLAKGFAMDHAGGAAVADVVEDSPADKAGVEVGDVIVRFGEKDIDNAKTLSRAVAATDPDDDVHMKVWRDGKQKNLRVKLGQSEDEPQADMQARSGDASSGNALGLDLAELNDSYRNRLGVPDGTDGVVITGVHPDSDAASEGLRPGDIISRINSTPVHNVNDAIRAAKAAADNSDHATLLVRRGEVQQFVSVALS